MNSTWMLLLRIAVVTAIFTIPLIAFAVNQVELSVGDAAPDVTLTNHEGQEVTLSNLWAESPVVVYFFPKAFTPG